MHALRASERALLGQEQPLRIVELPLGMRTMNDFPAQLLKAKLDVIEGEIVQIDDNTMWVRGGDKRELSVAADGVANSFRIGHSVRMVTTDVDSSPRMLKAQNLDTRYTVSTISDKNEVPGLIVAFLTGALGLGGVHLAALLLVPVLNLLVGLYSIFLALKYMGKVRHVGRSILIGFGVFFGVALFGAAIDKIFVALFAPAVGVFTCMGLIGRQTIIDSNSVADRVDSMLAVAGSTSRP